jgi:hypothetical protein
VFAVGKTVEIFLKRLRFPRLVTPPLIHYSPQVDRRKGLIGRENAFDEFKNAFTHEDVMKVACDVVAESGVPNEIGDRVLDRLQKRTLTLSRLRLMFNYRLAFESIPTKAC